MRSLLILHIIVPAMLLLGVCSAAIDQPLPDPSKPRQPGDPPGQIPGQRPKDPGQIPGKEPGLPTLPPHPGQGAQGDQLVKVRGLADVTRIKPGQPFQLAFVFNIEPQWHIYWQNSGASGLPTEIKITGPGGFTFGETRFPRPIAIGGEEGVTYGYEKQTVLLVDVTPPAELLPGRASFTANINWLVCKEKCLSGKTRIVVDVPTGAMELPGGEGSPDPIIAQYRAMLPQPGQKGQGFSTNYDGTNLNIRLPARGKTVAEFFPLESPGVTYGEAQIHADNSWITITVPVEVEPNNSEGKPMVIAGVVGLGSEQTDPCYEFEIPLSAP